MLPTVLVPTQTIIASGQVTIGEITEPSLTWANRNKFKLMLVKDVMGGIGSDSRWSIFSF